MCCAVLPSGPERYPVSVLRQQRDGLKGHRGTSVRTERTQGRAAFAALLVCAELEYWTPRLWWLWELFSGGVQPGPSTHSSTGL